MSGVRLSCMPLLLLRMVSYLLQSWTLPFCLFWPVFSLPVLAAGKSIWCLKNLWLIRLLGLPYDNMFSWTMRWSSNAIIEETHAYFDSALVTKLLLENEVGVYTYRDARDVLQVGPTGANCKLGV